VVSTLVIDVSQLHGYPSTMPREWLVILLNI